MGGDVVVAIIGVLVAVSIPIFTAQLEKAREATDVANIRAAYAAGSATLMTGIESATAAPTEWTVVNTDSEKTATGFYNIQSGKMSKDTSKAIKGTTAKGGSENIQIGTYTYNVTDDLTDHAIKVVVNYLTSTVTITTAS